MKTLTISVKHVASAKSQPCAACQSGFVPAEDTGSRVLSIKAPEEVRASLRRHSLVAAERAYFEMHRRPTARSVTLRLQKRDRRSLAAVASSNADARRARARYFGGALYSST